MKLRQTATVPVTVDERKLTYSLIMRPFFSTSGQSVLIKPGIKQEYAVIYYLYSGPGESGGVMRPPHVRR